MKSYLDEMLIQKEELFGVDNMELIEKTKLSHREKNRILDRIQNQIGEQTPRVKSKKHVMTKIIAVAASVAIVATAGIGVYRYFGADEIFTPQWAEAAGEGGGGYGGLGGSDGKYEVQNFVLAENFEMPDVEAVNVYQMLDGDQETRKDSMIALIEDYFDAKYNEQEDTFTTADGSMTDMLVWANGVYIYYEKSSEQTKQFRQDYQSYSLRKTEKQGLKVAKEFSEKLSAALGQPLSYVESYEKTVYLSYFSETDGEEAGQGAEFKTYTYRFTNGEKEKYLEVADGVNAYLLPEFLAEEVKTVDDVKNSYLDITVLPDGTINRVDGNIIDADFKVSGSRQMFTKEQLKNYDFFNESDIYFGSNVQNDTVVFERISGFYYHAPDFSASEDATACAYALLEYHLESDPDTVYQAGVYVDAVRENISTYDSLYSSVIKVEPADPDPEPEEPAETVDMYPVAGVQFDNNYDANGLTQIKRYSIQPNANADLLEELITDIRGEKMEFQSAFGAAKGAYDEKASFEYNTENAIFEYYYTKDDQETKEYIQAYDGATLDVTKMRETANAVAKTFEPVLGELEYDGCELTDFSLYTDADEYFVSAYRFHFKNAHTDDVLLQYGEETVTPTICGTQPDFSVVVLADLTVPEVLNHTTQGFIEGEESYSIQSLIEEVAQNTIESSVPDDTATVLGSWGYLLKMPSVDDTSFYLECVADVRLAQKDSEYFMLDIFY